MIQKAVHTVAKVGNNWAVMPVTTKDDIEAVLALYEMFEEYSGRIDDRKRSLQRQKMESHRHRYFLVKPHHNNGDNSTAGYYAVDLQNPQYPGKILFDQIFIHPDYRGQGLGTYLVSHFLHMVSETYYGALTTAKPVPKQIVVEHFREQSTSNPESLAAIRRTLKGFGFQDLRQKDPTTCPKTSLPLDEQILDYQSLSFRR